MILRILVSFLFTAGAQAADLKILSYNVFMLPKPMKNSLQKTRTKIIAQQLRNSDYELMFFQEAFMQEIRDELKSVLGKEFPHSYYLKSSGKVKHIFGSGVFIMSRYPFKVLDKIYFKECGSADCFAAKGSVLIETVLPSGKIVQFAPSHLQSKEALGPVRISQLKQMKAMLAKHARPGIPQVIAADLNIDFTEPEFDEGLKVMNMSYVTLVGAIKHTNGRDNECFKTAKNKEWIDHFWISEDHLDNRSTMKVREFVFSHKGKICPSSDHHAIEAELYFASR